MTKNIKTFVESFIINISQSLLERLRWPGKTAGRLFLSRKKEIKINMSKVEQQKSVILSL